MFLFYRKKGDYAADRPDKFPFYIWQHTVLAVTCMQIIIKNNAKHGIL
jgi:hypothetical protein